MTTEVDSNYWFRIITHYQNMLTEKYMYTYMTPATQHLMEEDINHWVMIARNRETHPAWHIPLILKFKPLEHSVFVEPADPNSLKLL